MFADKGARATNLGREVTRADDGVIPAREDKQLQWDKIFNFASS